MSLFGLLVLAGSLHGDPRVGQDVMDRLASGQSVRVTVALARTEARQKGRERGELNRDVARAQDRVLEKAGSVGIRVLRRHQSVFGMRLEIASFAALQRLLDSTEIVKIDGDATGGGGLTQSVPLVQADQVQAMGLSGTGHRLALIDTGIDTNHPDLAAAIIDQHCICSTNCCPNGLTQMSGPGSAEDDHGHGTHVAGIMLSRGTVSSPGMAPAASIVVVKALDAANGFSTSDDIVAALDWIYNNHPEVDAVNMSLYTNQKFSSPCDGATAWTLTWANAVDNLKAIGVLSVGIAGNDSLTGQAVAPGCFDNAVMTGASTKLDAAASFSNSTPMVDLFAPGVSINSDMIGGGLAFLGGTSMAAPHVTGATALLRQAHPAASVAQVWSALTSSAVTINDGKGLIRPRLNMLDASAKLDSYFPSPTPSPSFSVSPTITPSPTITETFTVSPTFSLSPTITGTFTISPTPTLAPTSETGPTQIRSAIFFPNPAGSKTAWLALDIQGEPLPIQAELYSPAYALLQRFKVGQAGGAAKFTDTLDIEKWPQGALFLKLTPEGQPGSSRVIKVYILR